MKTLLILCLILKMCRSEYFGGHYIDPSCWEEAPPKGGQYWPSETLCKTACSWQNKDYDQPPCTGVRFDEKTTECFVGNITCKPVRKTEQGHGYKVWIDIDVPAAQPETSPNIAILGGVGILNGQPFNDFQVATAIVKSDNLPNITQYDGEKMKMMPAMVNKDTFVLCGGMWTTSCYKHEAGSLGWTALPAMPRVRALATFIQVAHRLWVMYGRSKYFFI